MVRELNGDTFAVIIALTAFICSPAFLRSNTLFQPVTFNQFFWLLSGYLILRLIKTKKHLYWYYLFFVFGIAFLNKYSIAFFIVAFLAGMLLSEHRSLFWNRHFFFGGLLGVFIILPNLIWQYNHNWPLVQHMDALQRYQFANVSTIGFLVDQVMMNLPGVFVWSTGLIVFLFYREEKTYRIFGYIYVFVVLILLIMSGKSYYTLGLYTIFFALGGYAVEKYYKRAFKNAILGFMIVTALPLLPYSLPVLTHEQMAAYSEPMAPLTNRWEDGNIYNIPQDYADMTGWQDLADSVIDFYAALPDSQKKATWIFAENYGQAGAILFYGKQHGLPEPVSFSDNFLFWAPDSITQGPLIYINDDLGDIDDYFGSCKRVAQINNIYFRENGLMVYFCTDPKHEFLDFYSDKVNLLEERFR
jgi:hypothetical protein